MGAARLAMSRSFAAGEPHRAQVSGAHPAPGIDGAGLHFCIFQGDAEGLDGWSLEDGSMQNRWDTLLDGLLKCLMMDGAWPLEVRASAFVGGDALHLSGEVQSLAMPVAGQREDGRAMYQPATVRNWEEALWRARGQDLPGLCWRRRTVQPDASDSRAEARARLLDNLDEVLACSSGPVAVLVFTPVGARVTYDELKANGKNSAGCGGVHHVRDLITPVFVVLGGAHGFDGDDDKDGGAFLDAVLARFIARFGPACVLRLSLGENGGGVAPKFPLSKVAAFLSVEYACGGFARAVEGFWARRTMPG